MNCMVFAVIGSNGQLGRALIAEFGDAAIALGRAELDVTDEREVQRVIGELSCQAVVNCAAYTQVDQAEREPDACAAVNATAVGYLAKATRRARTTLVHVSTDYVFGGDDGTATPRRETDETSPQGVYARTKLEGEWLAAECPRHFIVRTCGLYGASPSGNNFVEKMLRLAASRDHLRVVDDQHCTPTYVAHLAQAIRFLLETEAYGMYHVVNAGETTWCKFAREIFAQTRIAVRVEPITTAEFGAAAARPCYSVLDTAKYRALGGPALPSWREALREYLASRGADSRRDREKI